MRVTATDRAADVVGEMTRRRAGVLTVTIGTGCCESTAPFLYEDFWPGPDQEPVGEVSGVTVYAPEYLRSQYPGDDGVTLDVVDELAESLSVETELGCRLILRGRGIDPARAPEVCEVPEGGAASKREPVLRPVVGELPAALRGLRMR
ncbi:MAG: DUF779 domain-containing protein [Actinobacteria bacterium]|nr:DUF779 domain-containing protein [Actinomycetota bacterium]